MKFEINNTEWIIEEKDKNELKELYEKETQEKTYFVFGVTVKSKHIIYINKDMCQEQKIRTLKHELTHCYIWEYGLYNVMDINEEVICDIVASSNDFINEVVEKYRKDHLLCTTCTISQTPDSLEMTSANGNKITIGF